MGNGQFSRAAPYFGINTPQHIAPDTLWTLLAAGGLHTVGLREDGTVWAWGCNWNGQLGTGSYNHGYSPTAVTSPVTAGVEWAAVSLEIGRAHV